MLKTALSPSFKCTQGRKMAAPNMDLALMWLRSYSDFGGEIL